MEKLIDQGEDLELRNDKNRTPLLEAVRKSKWQQAEILVSKGVNLNVTDKFRRNALDMVLHRRDFTYDLSRTSSAIFFAILRSCRFDLELVYEDLIISARALYPKPAPYIEDEVVRRKILKTFFIGHLFDHGCAVHNETIPIDVVKIILVNYMQLEGW